MMLKKTKGIFYDVSKNVSEDLCKINSCACASWERPTKAGSADSYQLT